ncbi:uncharacterized protein LOC113791607 [Dermatophagoides pteronyssinus]|uniref:uncharacterized protein LOC113791607 n=1 Tax=Dermatophagoides pteronyssinus TaxID=6956 RepID=UPI003F670F8B
MNVFMYLQSCFLFFYLIRMIVATNVQDENTHERMMIPYKSVYGVPSKCKGTSNHQTTEEKYQICQINAINKWKITLKHYYTESWNFCCFVYDVLECETKVLSECDEDYSDINDKETRRLFDKSCQPIMANNPCSKSEGGGKDWIWKGLGIAAGAGLLLYLIYVCVQFWRKEYNTELKALEAYKAEKFQKYYENEYVLAVYDNEVENLNKQWLTNASAQTNENGEAQPIKKQDSVKLSKKDLKKIEKKVISQIEAEPENSSFWDEFNEDRTKYYEKPTGVVAKSKKFFTRLWAEKKVNNEELMKKEELIRSQARRQFENIHTVDQSQSTEPGKLKSLVVAEDEDTDSLLAKTLNILNQQQVAVHEVIKTSDFPEPGKIDELEKWTKDFKDTRNKIRNEFNQKFELTLERPTSDDQTDKIEETKNKLVDTKLKQISESVQDPDSNKQIKAANDQTNKQKFKIGKAKNKLLDFKLKQISESNHETDSNKQIKAANDQKGKIEKTKNKLVDTKLKQKSESIQETDSNKQIKAANDQTAQIGKTKNKLLDTKLKPIPESPQETDSNEQLNDDSMNEKISQAANDQAAKIPKSDSFKKNKIQDTSAIIKADPIKSKIDSTNKQGDKIMQLLTGMLSNDGLDTNMPQTSNYVKKVKANYKTDNEEIYIESTLENISSTSPSEAKKKKNKQSVAYQKQPKSKPVETNESEIGNLRKKKVKRMKTNVSNVEDKKQSTSEPIVSQTDENQTAIASKVKNEQTTSSLVDKMKQTTSVPIVSQTNENQTAIASKVKNEQTTTSNLIDNIAQSTSKPVGNQTAKIPSNNTNIEDDIKIPANILDSPQLKEQLKKIEDINDMKEKESILTSKIKQLEFLYGDKNDIQELLEHFNANLEAKNMYNEEYRKDILLDIEMNNRYKKENEEKIAILENSIITGDAFKDVKRKMTDQEYNDKILDELNKYEIHLNEKEKTINKEFENEKIHSTLTPAERKYFFMEIERINKEIKRNKDMTKKLKEKMMEKQARTKRQAYDGTGIKLSETKKNETEKYALKKSLVSKDQASLNGQDSSSSSNDFSDSHDETQQTMLKQKSTNLSKQTMVDQPIEQNIEISQSNNIIDSLIKRIKKSIKPTILSVAKEIPDQQFTDYTKQL